MMRSDFQGSLEMKTIRVQSSPNLVRSILAITCAALLVGGTPLLHARSIQPQAAGPQESVKGPG